MKPIYRDLLKHSSIYGLGHILSRLSSFLLLPLYTSYLSPRDYGCMAILDLTLNVMSIVILSGMGEAVSRHHFEAENPTDQARVWWTGVTFLTLAATLLIAPAWFFRDKLAYITLGIQETQGSFYYALVLPTIWVRIVTSLSVESLRVQKRSSIVVFLSLTQLLANVGLNILFLVFLKMGIVGLLLGNFITSIIIGILRISTLIMSYNSYKISWPLMYSLLRFGSPLIIISLLTLIMSQSDRYFLRMFLTLDDVGIYSVAYMIAGGINVLILTPFNAIWNVAVYEVSSMPEAKNVYEKTFKYFVYFVIIIMLGVSLFVEPMLKIMAGPAYIKAASFVPIICLAYVFHSLHIHFKVPALLAKRTMSLLPASFVAAMLNVAANWVLIPWWGISGAAWAFTFTTVAYSFVGLGIYRKISKYDYPFMRCGAALLGIVATYIVVRSFLLDISYGIALAIAALFWFGWILVLFGPFVKQCLENQKINKCPSRIVSSH